MSNEHQSHPYHLVDPSPLPIFTAFSMFILAIGAVMFMHDVFLGKLVLPLGFALVISCMFSWWSDVIKEGQGKHHNKAVQNGLSIGMLLFILSEVMFFAAFFWSFFHARIFPHEMAAGEPWSVMSSIWPPKGIIPLDPWNLPLINTLILLLSGTTVTWAHYNLHHNMREEAAKALRITVLLGITFTLLQAYEYHHATFAFTEGIYPSNFFMATGFHGFHVIVGTIFLSVCYFRTKRGDFDAGNNRPLSKLASVRGFEGDSERKTGVYNEVHEDLSTESTCKSPTEVEFRKRSNMLGFEFAAWYWHFVDVVWIFLFIFVYVLG